LASASCCCNFLYNALQVIIASSHICALAASRSLRNRKRQAPAHAYSHGTTAHREVRACGPAHHAIITACNSNRRSASAPL
jgi:hypothetical protein